MEQKEAIRLKGKATRWERFKTSFLRWWPLYAMILPGLIYIIVYKYIPMGGIIIAFKNYKVKAGIWASEWVDPWYKYFAEFFKSPANVRIIKNTLIISIGKILVGLFPPLIFALAISECRSRKLARVVQTVAYLPHFLSWVVVYGICMTMLSETTGILNNLLQKLGFDAIPFLTSNKYIQGTLIFSDLWKTVGWSSITYLAAIMGIDQNLYEAARMDGCGRFRQIWHITIPGIRKIFVVLLILQIGNVLDAGFNQVYVFKNDQVAMSAEIIDTWVYTRGIGKMNYSLSTAVGLLKSVIGCVLVFSANKIARKWESAIW